LVQELAQWVHSTQTARCVVVQDRGVPPDVDSAESSATGDAFGGDRGCGNETTVQRQAPQNPKTRRHAPTCATDTETKMSSAIDVRSRRVTSLAMRVPSPSTCFYNDTDAAGGLQYYSSRGSIDHMYVPASATHTAAATT
jgi:hypothetical protein